MKTNIEIYKDLKDKNRGIQKGTCFTVLTSRRYFKHSDTSSIRCLGYIKIPVVTSSYKKTYVLTPITKTCLFKYIENFTSKTEKKNQIKKLTFFHISAQNIHCQNSLEPPRRSGSNEYP